MPEHSESICRSCFHSCVCGQFNEHRNSYNEKCHFFNDHFVPAADVVLPPCKIGDAVWAIRSFKGERHPKKGFVSEMFFLEDMTLQIVVKYVTRGQFGKTVFLTLEDAEAALKGGADNA